MSAIWDFLWTLFHPSYWIMNYPYSSEWDAKIRELASKHEFTRSDGYIAYLGTNCIWIKSHPYASFTPLDPDVDCRPSRRTIHALREKLISDDGGEMNAIWDFLWLLLHPVYMREYRYPYSYSWDQELLQLARDHKFTRGESRHTAHLGPEEIWVSNHPAVSFTPYIPQREFPVRPSCRTIHFLNKKLISDLKEGI